MKIKKKIKIPKYTLGGDSVTFADSNMIQGIDTGMSSYPDYTIPQTTNNTANIQMASGIMNGLGSTMPSQVELSPEQKQLEAGKDQLAQSNPFIGLFRGIEKMGNNIGGAIGGKKGEETMRSITDPFQNGIGSLKNRNLTAGQKALQFLPFGNFALPEMDARFDKEFSTKNAGSNLNFGVAKYGGVIKYKDGGLVNTSSEDFKQFNTESHEEGGQYIDKNKNPTNNPDKAVAEIEKKENSYKDYIFSDTLLYKGNKTFANQADKINKKYKDREDVISKNSLDIELTDLMKKNEKVKTQIQQTQQLAQAVLEFGGEIPKFTKGGFNSYPSWLSDIPQLESERGSENGTGLSNYGFNNNVDGTPATPPKDLQEATIRIGEQYLPMVKDYPSFIQPQLLDYKYNSGRSIKDLLLYSQGKISLSDINSKNTYDKEYDTKYKSDIEKAMTEDPKGFYEKLVKARHDVAKTTHGYTLDNPNPAYEKSWKGRIENFKYGDENPGKGISKETPKTETRLNPSDPDYFTKLMEQQGVINNTSVPVPDITFAYPEERNTVDTTDIVKDVYIPEINTITDTTVPTLTQEKTRNKPSALEIAGYGIKGAELLGHAIQAFKKPELVNPVYNPEENAIKSLMKNRSVDVQSILNELDLQEASAKENIANNSTSVGVMQANLQKLNSNIVDSIAKTKFNEQLQNNQYRADEASVLGNLGQQKVIAQNYAEDLNTKAKANVQIQRDKFLKESIGGLGDFLLKKDYVNKENNFQMNILKQKGINFTVNDDWKSFSQAGIDITKFDGEIESLTDKSARQAKIDALNKKLEASGVSKEGRDEFVKHYTNKYLK